MNEIKKIKKIISRLGANFIIFFSGLKKSKYINYVVYFLFYLDSAKRYNDDS